MHEMVKATNSIGNRILKLYVKTTDERNLRKIPVPASPATLLKKTMARVFSCDFCEIFFFTEHLRAAASISSRTDS